ncbi:MAG: Gfo/Idh/MocA family oxidoreductase [Caldilineaceae bacterium]
MRTLKLAVVGAGLIGQKHLELVATNADCELVAICDAQPHAAALAAKYGVRFYREYAAMLSAEPLDGVIIATPTPLHAAVGIACAEYNIPMLVEKPIAATLAEANALVTAAEARGVPLLVGHHRRHNPLVQQARAIIRGGALGNLVGVSAFFTLLKPADYFQVVWRTQPGGGPILINLIHDIDNLRFICGEIECVFSMTSSGVRGFAVEDTASITLRFANGALGSILASDATPAPWSYELTSRENPVYPTTGQDCYYFTGTGGTLAFPSLTVWRYPQGPVAGWHQPLTQHRLATKLADPLPAQLAHFCRVIRGEEAPLVSGWEGLKTLAVTLAALESAQTGQPVQLMNTWPVMNTWPASQEAGQTEPATA